MSDGERPANPSDGDWPSPARAWYTVVVLMLAVMFGAIDRSVISLLIDPIKRDFGVSDTQMSFLIGFAFVFFYVAFGLPIARLADVRSRRTIIGVGVIVWTSMTTLCGFAQSYWQLFLARVGVGGGESSITPASFSIMTDTFPRERLTLAMSVLSASVTLGAGLSHIIGGFVIQLVTGLPEVSLPVVGVIRAWQWTFIAIGLPGFLVALLFTTIKEPRRRGVLRPGGNPGAKPKSLPVREIFRYLNAERRTYLPIYVGMSLKVTLSLGASIWVPAFIMRTYGWSAPQVGYTTGLITIIASPLGMYLGGLLAERMEKKGRIDANMRVVLLATALVLPTSILYPLMPSAPLALALMGLNTFFAGIGVGPGNTALQVVTPNQMRGQVSALYLLVFNLIGFGLGPVLVASLTDYVFGAPEDVRYALATAAMILSPIALIVTFTGVKPYGESVARAAKWT